MRRLFWVGVGAVGAVVVARRVNEVARRYTPAGVSEQVEAAGQRTSSALRTAATRFREAMDQREQDLVAELLVTPEDGDPDAVFGAGRRRAAQARSVSDDDAPSSPPASGPTGRHAARPTGRVDDDEPLYEF